MAIDMDVRTLSCILLFPLLLISLFLPWLLPVRHSTFKPYEWEERSCYNFVELFIVKNEYSGLRLVEFMESSGDEALKIAVNGLKILIIGIILILIGLISRRRIIAGLGGLVIVIGSSMWIYYVQVSKPRFPVNLLISDNPIGIGAYVAILLGLIYLFLCFCDYIPKISGRNI